MRRVGRRGVRVVEQPQREAARGGRPHAQGSLPVSKARTERDRCRVSGVQVVENSRNLQGGRVDALARARRADDDLALEALGGERDGGGWQLESRQSREMREARSLGSREARRVMSQPPAPRALAANDAGAIERERAFRVGEQCDRRVRGYVPRDRIGRQPVRLRLGEVAPDATDDHPQLLRDGIPLECHVHAVRRDRECDVGSARHATLTVVHVPTAIERDFGLVGSGGNRARAEAVDRRVVDVLQPGTEAGRIPVARAAELALKTAGHGGDDGADVVGDPMRLVIVEKGDALRRGGRREGNVRSVLLRVQTVVDVPGAVEGHLVLVRAGRRDAERVAPDVAVRVIDELRRGATGIPVAGTTRLGLVAARDADGCGRHLRGHAETAHAREGENDGRHHGASAPAER
jgi:hypothetical protein